MIGKKQKTSDLLAYKAELKRLAIARTKPAIPIAQVIKNERSRISDSNFIALCDKNEYLERQAERNDAFGVKVKINVNT